MGAVEAVEYIYKQSNPKLKIIEAIPGTGEKGFIKYKFGKIKRINILHISDIHYSEENDPDIKVIFHEFLEDIKKWKEQNSEERIDFICLTGDIAGAGELPHYQSIEKRIKDILEVTGCTKDELFFVPGNHDVEKYDKISDKNKKTLEGVCDNQIDINSQVLNNHENYKDFFNKFNNFYTFLDDYGYNNSLIESEDHSPKPWYSRKLKDYPVRIIGLNSALFSCKAFKDYGKMGMGTRQLKEAYFKDKTGDDEQIIVLSHHPINWLCEKEHDELSILMERYSIIHLHGHTHKIKPRKLFSFSGSYFTIGTGSLYGKKGIDDINTYHILTLDFEKNEINIWARRWIPEQMMWALYSDEINNKFPFPRRIRKAS
jgi:predicted phosphodiesterase